MHKYIGYPFKGAFYMLCMLFMLFMALSYLVMNYWLASAIFGGIFILFVWVFSGHCNRIIIDDNGITQYIFYFIKDKYYSWDDVKDVGIAYTEPLQRRGKKKGSVKCAFYFSTEQRTPKELMKLCISWPPREVIHMGYSEQKLQTVLEHWTKPISLYNTTYISLFGNAPVPNNHGFNEIVY